jgi:hypothetical protein
MPLAECTLALLLMVAPVAVVIPLETWPGATLLALRPDVVVLPLAVRPLVTAVPLVFAVVVGPARVGADEAIVVDGDFSPRLTAPIVVP